MYTLSVKHSSGVAHWRIATVKDTVGYHFKIDESPYNGFMDVIQIHKLKPLKVKDNAESIVLTSAVERDF